MTITNLGENTRQALKRLLAVLSFAVGAAALQVNLLSATCCASCPGGGSACCSGDECSASSTSCSAWTGSMEASASCS